MDCYFFIWDTIGKHIPIEVNMVIKIGYTKE